MAFNVLTSGGFPINILNTIKAVPEVCAIYCATGNPVEVIAATPGLSRRLAAVAALKSLTVRQAAELVESKRLGTPS